MAHDIPGDAPLPSAAAPSAAFCSPCNMWLNGAEQLSVHRAGKKHRRRLRSPRQAQFTGDQLYWARFAARYHLQMLYTRHTVRLARLACTAGTPSGALHTAPQPLQAFPASPA
eukprot:8829032-Lingulodinium_polyedra.AAC.1